MEGTKQAQSRDFLHKLKGQASRTTERLLPFHERKGVSNADSLPDAIRADDGKAALQIQSELKVAKKCGTACVWGEG